MSYFLVQIILAAGDSDGEDTIWMQMLVLVVLVAILGIGSVIKTQASRFKGQGGRGSYTWLRWLIKPLKELRYNRLGVLAAQSKVTIEEPVLFGSPDAAGMKEPKKELAGENGRDLAGGMEMLELEFLLSVVEEAGGDDKNDVAMRQLNFNELIRREQVNEIDSNALKIYARDGGGLYGKDIQCEAIRELTVRTARKMNIVV